MYAPDLVELLDRAEARTRAWRRLGYALMFVAAMVAAGVVWPT